MILDLQADKMSSSDPYDFLPDAQAKEAMMKLYGTPNYIQIIT